MTKTIEVTGDERVIRDLQAKGTAATRLKPVMSNVADFAERQITGVPIDTGRLARSIRGGSEQLRRITDQGFDLGSTVDYARFVFRGTKHMRAQPPKINTDAISRRAATDINKEIERA